jgi:hypothetical protein
LFVQLYTRTVVPLVDKVMDGFNATVLAYGQTASGKTFTMGSAGPAGCEDDVGVIPRALTDVFEAKQRKEAAGVSSGPVTSLPGLKIPGCVNWASASFGSVDKTVFHGLCPQDQVEISVEFMEIYQEEVYDLLSTLREEGQKCVPFATRHPSTCC